MKVNDYKFWKSRIESAPDDSTGAFDQFVQDSRSMDQEPRNMFDGGGLTMDSVRVIGDLKSAKNAWRKYKGNRKNPRLSYPKFFEIWARENMAEGGRMGYSYAGIVKQGPNKGKHKYTDFYPKTTNGSLHEWFDSKKEMNEALQQRKEASGRGLTEKELTKKYKKQIKQKGYKTWGEVPDNIKRSISTNVSSPYEKIGRTKIYPKTVKLFEKTKPIKPSTGLPYTQEEFIKLTDGQKQKLVLRMKGEKKPGVKYKKVKGYYPEKEGNRLLNYMKLAAEKQGKLPIKDRTYTNVFVDGKFVGVNDIKNNKLYTHIDYDLSKKGAKKGVSIMAQDASGKFLHPDMDNFLTYFNAAKKFKTEKPNKVLESYFAKYERVPTYNEIYTFFTTDRNAPLKTYKNNSLTIQHQELMGIEPTKNFQLLTQIKNTEANTILNRLKRGEISKARANYDLKKIGAAQEGIGIAKKDITASKGLAVAKREAVKLFKDAQKVNPDIVKEITKKLEINLLKELQSFCEYGKSTGGRIGFGGGSCSPEVAKRNFLLATNDVANRKITGEAAEQIAKNAGKVVAKAGSKSALASIFGPAGIGLDIAFEIGSIGVDMYANKRPFKEALQDNWITGAFMPGTSQEEFHKRLFKKDSRTKAYGSGLELIDAYSNLDEKIEKMKVDSSDRGRARAEKELPGLERDLRAIAAQYNALGSIMEEGSPEHEAYMAAVTEVRDADKAKSAASAAKLKMELDAPTSDRYMSTFTPTREMKIDFNLPKGHTMDMAAPGAPMTTSFKPTLPTIEDLNKIWKDEGFEGTLSTDRAKELITGEKWRQLFEQPGIRGSQDWRGAIGGRAGYMGGGITGIRKPNAIPPKRQGLRSILINGKKS